jgi:hypothetical protein
VVARRPDAGNAFSSQSLTKLATVDRTSLTDSSAVNRLRASSSFATTSRRSLPYTTCLRGLGVRGRSDFARILAALIKYSALTG